MIINLKLKCIILLFLGCLLSCSTQEKRGSVNSQSKTGLNDSEEVGDQIADYVVDAHEDAIGNLWFGTLERGVARYDGKMLKYFTTKDGLPSNRVVGIVEDDSGNLWFGTGAGISSYDGNSFTNYSSKDGLCNDMVSNLLIDNKGVLWIGTWGGVCTFDGKVFTDFDIPLPIIDTKINEDTKEWITALMEDSKGNIWIGKDGYGASKYDGESFEYFVKSDGLYSNFVQAIVEDTKGDIWLSARVGEKDNPDPKYKKGKGGVVKYNGDNFQYFTDIQGLNDNDVYELYRDDLDNIWIGTVSNGVYKYDGETFLNYEIPKSAMKILIDSKKRIWAGCAGGLYRIESTGVINVTKNGPWE